MLAGLLGQALYCGIVGILDGDGVVQELSCPDFEFLLLCIVLEIDRPLNGFVCCMAMLRGGCDHSGVLVWVAIQVLVDEVRGGQEKPGAARSSQGQRQKQPGAARSSQEQP